MNEALYQLSYAVQSGRCPEADFAEGIRTPVLTPLQGALCQTELQLPSGAGRIRTCDLFRVREAR